MTKEHTLKRTIWGLIFIGLIFGGTQAVFAQNEGDGGDAGSSDTGGSEAAGNADSAGGGRTRVIAGNVVSNQSFSVYLNTSAYRFSNGDLRRTDDTSYTTVDYTDDELFLVYATLGLIYNATLLDYVGVNIELYKPGYYGNDSLAGATTENILYTKNLNFDVNFGKLLFGWETNELDLVVGRQRYQLCPDSSFKEFVFDDTLDAVKLRAFFPQIHLGGDVLVDFFSMNSPADSVYALSTAQQEYTVEHFNGDVNIIRLAVVPEFSMDFQGGALKNIDAKGYYLFSRIGATGDGEYDSGGYEMTEIGVKGNFADNDWVMIGGLSAYADLSFLTAYLEGAYSWGVDRKAQGVPDVNISGWLGHLSLLGNFGFAGLDWLEIAADGLYVTGATTDGYGNYLNYGFVSFKGNRIGGFLFDTYYGNYGSAIVNYDGIDYEAIDASRRAATICVGGSVAIDMLDFTKMAKSGDKGFNTELSGWVYFDNNTTSMDTNNSLTADVYDQLRYGKFMGYELDADISYVFRGGVLETGVKGGMFVPMDFFFIPASLDSAPYGLDTFWGLQVYANLNF